MAHATQSAVVGPRRARAACLSARSLTATSVHRSPIRVAAKLRHARSTAKSPSGGLGKLAAHRVVRVPPSAGALSRLTRCSTATPAQRWPSPHCATSKRAPSTVSSQTTAHGVLARAAAETVSQRDPAMYSRQYSTAARRVQCSPMPFRVPVTRAPSTASCRIGGFGRTAQKHVVGGSTLAVAWWSSSLSTVALHAHR